MIISITQAAGAVVDKKVRDPLLNWTRRIRCKVQDVLNLWCYGYDGPPIMLASLAAQLKPHAAAC